MINLRPERLERIHHAVSEMVRLSREAAAEADEGTLEECAAGDDLLEWERLLEEIDGLLTARH